MSSISSVSDWIHQLKEGDPAAAQKVWERYCGQLLQLARKKLLGGQRRVADEEDVVQSAFLSFCGGAIRGGFTHLADRGDLWQLLIVLTERKALNLLKHERRQKRGGGAGPVVPLDEIVPSPARNPAFAMQIAEEFQLLLDRLGDDELRLLALRKMEGYTHEEIAAELGCVTRTVERKLRLIRKIWDQEAVS
jgi:RNA polymerase sigma factor (sigma-70 family)